jgi:hypothetical protein
MHWSMPNVSMTATSFSPLHKCLQHRVQQHRRSIHRCTQQPPSLTVLTRAIDDIMLRLSGVPPVGFGGRLRVIIDKRLQAVTADSAQPQAPAPAAATSAPAYHNPATATSSLDHRAAASSRPESSTPSSTGRSSVATVAAMAAVSVQNRPTDTSQPAAATVTDATTLAAAHSCGDNTPGGPSASSSTGEHALLAVQCGATAVLRLSFGQLLQLSGGADIADVADAPAEAAAPVSTLTGAAGSSPQTPVSVPLRVCTQVILSACCVRCWPSTHPACKA